MPEKIKIKRKAGVEPVIQITLSAGRNEHPVFDPSTQEFAVEADVAAAAIASGGFEEITGGSTKLKAEDAQ